MFFLIVVNCSDLVGSFFAYNHCVSRVTGFLTSDSMCQREKANNSKSESKTCNRVGFEPPLTSPTSALGIAIHGFLSCLNTLNT